MCVFEIAHSRLLEGPRSAIFFSNSAPRFSRLAKAPESSRVWFLTLAIPNIKKNSKIIMCVLEIQHSRYTQPRSRAKNMMFLYVTRELLHGFPFNLKPCWISSCCIELQSLGSKTLAVVEISPIAVLAAAPILKRNTFLGISLELLHGFSFKLQQC